MKEKVFNWIDLHKEELITDLRDIVRIKSVSTDTPCVKQALTQFLAIAQRMGFITKSVLDDRVGIVEWGNGKETIGVLVHLDVVAAGEREKWSCDPFEGIIEKDFLYGRGTVDDKGPAVASLYALKALKESGIDFHKKVQIVIGTQEETEWTEMQEYVRSFPLPDFGFTPDGNFPISNREKGYVDVEFRFEKPYTAGTNGLQILSLQGGSATNTIPACAKAFLGGNELQMAALRNFWLRDSPEAYSNISFLKFEENNSIAVITAEGKSAHSSQPQKGINAIERLCEFLNNCLSEITSLSDVARFIDGKKEDAYGRKWGLYWMQDIFDGEFFDHTTIAPTLLKTTNDSFIINYNLRTSPPIDRPMLQSIFSESLKGYRATYEITEYKPPLLVSSKKPFLEIMAKAYEEVSLADTVAKASADTVAKSSTERAGKTVVTNRFSLVYGTTYAKAMPDFVCWGPLFPGDQDRCHEEDESISLPQLIKATKVYALGLARMVEEENALKSGIIHSDG